ncbi:Putative BTB/POZ domain-containing protein [Septoria linicola]|uniref:BTB/POZ domain-containing protein n=1 Tax=Septoria linicola TaxID=215465 RepID=A0A9Q9AZD5_9PEZI|nr:putative BTB/POZ domain-containing protein [Septoria linicola]USW55315.1 Putative BTB/POZ domain-containing protein [Septoria linicola]
METETTEIERSDVAADGDLIITVGGQLELRVHSLLLKMNSPVFRTMLGPDWLEGQQLANISPATPGALSLPGDDPKAMQVLCFILHAQNDQLPSRPDSTNLLGLAKAADKYDCAQAVKFHAEAWLSRTGVGTKRQAKDLLEITLLLDFPSYFSEFSDAVVKDTRQSDQWEGILVDDDTGVMRAIRARWCYYDSDIVYGPTQNMKHLCGLLDGSYAHYENYEEGIGPGHDDFDADEETAKICRFVREGVTCMKEAFPTVNSTPLMSYSTHLQTVVEAGFWPGEHFLSLGYLLQKLKVVRFGGLKDVDYCDRHCVWEPLDEATKILQAFPGDMERLTERARMANLACCLDCFKAPNGRASICRVPHQSTLATRATYNAG